MINSKPSEEIKENLGEELCRYCPLEEEEKGIHSTPNGYYSCEGTHCDIACEYYLEEHEDNSM